MYRPKIKFSWYMHELIKQIHKNPTWAQKEWSGIVRMVADGEGYKAVDIHFPEQTNSKSLTTLEEKGLDDFITGILDTKPEQCAEWVCWLHSHNNMTAFWSGTDVNTRNSYAKQAPAYISIVTSTGGFSPGYDGGGSKDGVYYYGTFDVFTPTRLEFECEITVEDVPDDVRSSQQHLIDRKVQEKIQEIEAQYRVQVEEVSGYLDTVAQYLNTDVTALGTSVTDGLLAKLEEEKDRALVQISGDYSSYDCFVIDNEIKCIDDYIKSLKDAEKVKTKHTGGYRKKRWWDDNSDDDDDTYPYGAGGSRVQPYETKDKGTTLSVSNHPIKGDWIINYTSNEMYEVDKVNYGEQKLMLIGLDQKQYYIEFSKYYLFKYM